MRSLVPGGALAVIAVLMLALGTGWVHAQSSALPATQPSALPAARAAELPATAGPGMEVSYAQGLLRISAGGAGLNQILREIARQTGMKITGAVADERVYGKYGPAPPSRVLESLLEGTGVNMMVRETAGDAPEELILSSRNGGPMPTSFSAGAQYGTSRTAGSRPPPQSVVPTTPGAQPGGARPQPLWAPAVPQGIPQPEAAGAANRTVNSPAPVYTTPTLTEPVDPPPAETGSDGNGAASPNGVKSPQQIYNELQQLQQQQPKP